MGYEAFEFEVTDGIGHISLNQPDRGNPIDLTFTTELSRIATQCDEDPAVRCVLIDARGRYFSVGADLKTMAGDPDGLPVFIKDATVGLHSAISRFARMDAPVVVSVHGLAVGGAVSLSAVGDFCLAAETAEFYAGYTGIGLVPDGGGSTFVPRRVGARRATEFFLRNQRWTARQAAEYGLINATVDDEQLAKESRALAAELAAGPTRAFGETKNLLLSSAEQPIEAQMEQEARAMGRAVRSEDGRAGITSVRAKEKPQFRGR